MANKSKLELIEELKKAGVNEEVLESATKAELEELANKMKSSSDSTEKSEAEENPEEPMEGTLNEEDVKEFQAKKEEQKKTGQTYKMELNVIHNGTKYEKGQLLPPDFENLSLFIRNGFCR